MKVRCRVFFSWMRWRNATEREIRGKKDAARMAGRTAEREEKHRAVARLPGRAVRWRVQETANALVGMTGRSGEGPGFATR